MQTIKIMCKKSTQQQQNVCGEARIFLS